jgi:hypothetical protein
MGPPAPTSSSTPLLLFALTACNVPAFVAQRQRELREPATGLLSLSCRTDNGGIEVRGVAGADAIAIRVVMQARGDSRAEADANVAKLDVAVERHGAELALRGVWPDELDEDCSPSFAFTIEVPPELALQLVSHNGGLRAFDVSGDLHAGTHNGRIEARTGAGTVDLESHNGPIELQLDGTGPVRGHVRSHNGAVAVDLGGRAAEVLASTHNGTIAVARPEVETDRSDNSVLLRVGGGGSELQLITHNGDVTVR